MTHIIAISAGHTPTRPGATQGNISEYSLTTAIAGRLCQLLSEKGYFAWIIGADTNANQIDAINKLNPSCGLELHFNSFTDGTMHGTEVLHAGSKRGIQLAQHIQNNLLDRLGTKDRGIKKGYYQGDYRKPLVEMLSKTNCPFVIPEPLFLSNPGDFAKVGSGMRELVAIALCDGIELYLGGI